MPGVGWRTPGVWRTGATATRGRRVASGLFSFAPASQLPCQPCRNPRLHRGAGAPRRTRCTEERRTENPLYIGDVLVYPNLGEPIRKSRDKALSFYVSVAGAAGKAPIASVEILRNGQTLGQARTAFPAPDPSDRIQHIAQIPLDGVAPGHYTLRLTIYQDDRHVTRDAAFTLHE